MLRYFKPQVPGNTLLPAVLAATAAAGREIELLRLTPGKEGAKRSPYYRYTDEERAAIGKFAWKPLIVLSAVCTSMTNARATAVARDEAKKISLFFYRLCYSPMLHIVSDYAPPYSDYAPTCSNYALQYSSKLDMVQKLSVLFN